MTKHEIINELAKDKTVEKLVEKLSTIYTDSLLDLSQYIYLYLYEREDKLVEELYDNGQLIFYIIRMIKNQLLSTHSSYYKLYRKYNYDNELSPALLTEEPF